MPAVDRITLVRLKIYPARGRLTAFVLSRLCRDKREEVLCDLCVSAVNYNPMIRQKRSDRDKASRLCHSHFSLCASRVVMGFMFVSE